MNLTRAGTEQTPLVQAFMLGYAVDTTADGWCDPTNIREVSDFLDELQGHARTFRAELTLDDVPTLDLPAGLVGTVTLAYLAGIAFRAGDRRGWERHCEAD